MKMSSFAGLCTTVPNVHGLLVRIFHPKHFFQIFGGHKFFFVGPLKPLFWTSGDVSSGFQSQSGQPYLCT